MVIVSWHLDTHNPLWFDVIDNIWFELCASLFDLGYVYIIWFLPKSTFSLNCILAVFVCQNAPALSCGHFYHPGDMPGYCQFAHASSASDFAVQSYTEATALMQMFKLCFLVLCKSGQ